MYPGFSNEKCTFVSVRIAHVRFEDPLAEYIYFTQRHIQEEEEEEMQKWDYTISLLQNQHAALSGPVVQVCKNPRER